MKLRDLVQNVERWLDTHGSDRAVGEALAEQVQTYDPDTLERLWADPGELGDEICRRAEEIAGPDHEGTLCWGEYSWTPGSRPNW